MNGGERGREGDSEAGLGSEDLQEGRCPKDSEGLTVIWRGRRVWLRRARAQRVQERLRAIYHELAAGVRARLEEGGGHSWGKGHFAVHEAEDEEDTHRKSEGRRSRMDYGCTSHGEQGKESNEEALRLVLDLHGPGAAIHRRLGGG